MLLFALPLKPREFDCNHMVFFIQFTDKPIDLKWIFICVCVYVCVSVCVCVCLATFSYRVPQNADYFLRQQGDERGLWYTTEEKQQSRTHEAFIPFTKKSLPLNLYAPQQVGYASSCWLHPPGHRRKCFIIFDFCRYASEQFIFKFYGRKILNVLSCCHVQVWFQIYFKIIAIGIIL